MSPLSKIPFLSALTDPDLEALAFLMERRSYEAGDLVYAQGTAGDALYVVEAGAVRVSTRASSDGEVLAHIDDGGTFGEAALLDERPRPTAVRAATDCTLLVLTRAAFQGYLAAHPDAGDAVTRGLAQRPRYSPRQLALHVLKPMPVFGGCTDDLLRAIAGKLQPVQFRNGQTIFSKGDPATVLYIVETGRVRLATGGRGRGSVTEVAAGDCFGEEALVSGDVRPLGALAAADSELWTLSRPDFEALFPAHPAAFLAVNRALVAHMELRNECMPGAQISARPAEPAPVAVAPVPAAEPGPSGPSLSSWFAGLSAGAKLRLAAAGLLVLWLALVSVPAIVARAGAGAARNAVLDERALTSVRTSRGAEIPAALLLSPAVDEVVDAAEAPVVSLAELVATPVKEAPAVAVLAAPAAPPTAAPVAMPAPPPTPEPKKTAKYTIKGGDTLSAIAAEFGVALGVLAEANGIDNPALINVGQELTIPGGAEVAAIAARLAAAPTATPAPVARVAAPASAPAAPPPAPPTPKPSLPFTWDGRMNEFGIRMDAAGVAPGQKYWRLVKALYRGPTDPVPAGLPGGDHNIYIETIDENGNRLTGITALVQNGGLSKIITENKPFPEYGSNYPMYGMMGSYSASIDGLPSDKVVGMGLPMKHHVSFFLTFQRATK